MNELSERIASLTPEKRRLLERRLRKEGLGALKAPPIPPRPEREFYPLSFGQQRLWFIDQLVPGTPAYNIPFAGRLKGALDARVLERSINEIVRRQEALRTVFKTVDGQPVQLILPELRVALPVVDLRGLDEREREAEAARLVNEEAQIPFDLSRAPLLRIRLLRLGDEDHTLLVTMPHIITDAWSMGVFFRELPVIYDAVNGGGRPPLPELPVQCADYAVWQREHLSGEALAEQLEYWERELADAPTVLELPTDRPRPPVQTFNGVRHAVDIPLEVAGALGALSQREGVTLFMTLLAAFNVLLYRYTGQEDILVGSPVATRGQAETQSLIGFFINTLVFRTRLHGDPTFRELLARVRETCLGAYAHQDVPFEKLVEAMGVERDLSRQPLVQANFVLQNVHIPPPAFHGLTLESFQQTDTRTAKVDLTLGLWETGAGVEGWFEYNTDLFGAETIARMSRHLRMLLEAIVANPDRRLSELPLLTDEERRQILIGWNQTATSYPRHARIHRLFEEQAARTPDAVALLFDDQQVTYAELNRRANQLAHHLQTLGVRSDVPVGVMMERSVELIVALLGVLKAGGAYLPLDPEYLQERLAFMLADTRAPVLLTERRLLEHSPAHDAQVICLDADSKTISQRSAENPADTATADNLAYVIYTSGSTGQPKGIAVPHRAVVRLVKETDYVGFGPGEVFLQFAPVSFDASTFEVWGSLLNGARLVIPPPGTLSLEELGSVIKEHRVTTLWLTAGLFHLMADERAEDLRGVRQLLAGGDVLSAAHVRKALREVGGLRLINGYGPTEATTFTCCYSITDAGQVGRSVPIGRPIANTEVYVLDEYLNPVPVGVVGELHIGGDGLARGYVNRPELTAKRFIPHPFSKAAGARLYRTGDQARYLEDGNIEFLGRTDDQVKVRGYRIELGEIESVLSGHEGVRECVVAVHGDGAAEKRLTAYVVPEGEEALTASELRGYLKEKLPEYMVPPAYVFLGEMPLTPNGKVDRKALPAPDGERPESEESFVAPRDQVEQRLAAVWAEVLGLERVGVNDNFFDLGGDSILSIQIISRANQSGFRLSPKHIFEHPTIAELAEAAGTAQAVPAEQGAVTGEVMLTPIQHWFFEQELADPHHWNMAMLLEAKERLQPALVEQAVGRLLEHHDALRLRFERRESGWRQFNADAGGAVPFRVMDLSAVPEAERAKAIEEAAAEAQAGLNLEEGPLARVVQFDFGAERPGRLLIVIHHLAVDAVSWRFLLEDFETAYEQLKRGAVAVLPPKTTSFKQWAEKVTEYARSAELRRELGYWLDESRRSAARLPLDVESGANTEASARDVSISLGAEETRALLQEVPRAYRTEINDALLTALAQALSRWAGARSLLVDVEWHGREQVIEGVDASRTVGWFTTIFPALLKPSEIKGPGEALKSVKEQLRQVPQHGIGYGLLRYLGGDEEVAEKLRSLPRAEVSFNYLGQLDQFLSTSSLLRLARESSGGPHSPRARRRYLLEINAYILGGELQMVWTYSEALHRRATIEGLAGSYTELLRALTEHCRSPEASGYTPSDFPKAKLGQKELDKLVAKIGRTGGRG